jgi:organic radical activating enzyme
MDATKLEVLQEVQKLVPKHTPKFHKMPIVITGGEPLLQLDEDLVTTLSIHGFELHLETNGTLLAVSRDYFKSITISPKTSHPIRPIQMWMQNNEGSGKIYLNVIYDTRRPEWLSQVMEGWRHLPWTRKFLQPCMRTMEGPNIDEVLAYCQSHPDWAISLQFHKILALDR